jgi:predicted O-methyltransferase YrrM
MDSDRFARELPSLFADYPRSEHPLDRRFRRVAEEVENLARENNLALLNLAASCMGPDETYVEIGVFHGASLIAAMLGNEGRSFVGVDGFEFRDGSLDLIGGGALDGRRVGVWYYDALHTYEAQVAGLRAAEAFLAPGALVIVDDSDWEQVARAIDDYLDSQPRARTLLSVAGSSHGLPHWWEGMAVLVWDG